MKTTLSAANPSEVETDCLAVVVLDRGEKGKTDAFVDSSDSAVEAAAKDVIASGEATGKPLENTLLHNPAGLRARRLLLIGGGNNAKFSASDLRKLAGAAVRALKSKSVRSFAFAAPPSVNAAEAARAIVEGAFVGNFEPDYYKSDRKDQSIDALTVVAKGDLQRAVDEARISGESQNFVCDLVNEPSNRMTPTILGERARKMAQEVGLTCEVYGADKIKELKMGAFWSVAQGSDEPPALIVLKYEPAGAPEKPVLGLVGKGITFDTGGISIKPADGMEKMKYDMAGGAAMIGAMRAIGLLKPKTKVTAVVCASENMPSGHAQKPGDIQTAMSGKSIEIINTDAEGRLVLADGLYYARTLGCTHLIDAATLTGACVIALGSVNAGVFSSDEDAYQHFTRALDRSGEKFWRLPVDAEYFESIRSNIADIMNSGGRGGGASTAAMFLKEFAEDTPWVHLDIAGTAWLDDAKPHMAKGPSGVPLRTLVHLAMNWGD